MAGNSAYAKALPRLQIKPRPAHLLTRKEFMRRVGLTGKEFMSLVHTQMLRAVMMGQNGRLLYSEDDVRRLREHLREEIKAKAAIVRERKAMAMVYPASLAVRVFKLIQDGRTLDQILVETEAHPQHIRLITDAYCDMSETLFVSRKTLDDIANLPIDGAIFPIMNEGDLMLAFDAAMRMQLCLTCERNHRAPSCTSCLTKRRLEAAHGTEDETLPDAGDDPGLRAYTSM